MKKIKEWLAWTFSMKLPNPFQRVASVEFFDGLDDDDDARYYNMWLNDLGLTKLFCWTRTYLLATVSSRALQEMRQL